ncbi:hypothetical protein Ahy_A07g034791 [Arachis hypogaea]|uniref:Uncharacterized protein n=1 Tax=Arachis hypogaea TaxID=3818 RepID=A0A445CCQ8_ARAHY|nr:hypothetical protein Ahy_A07g034791 [Arachis hypogaea]
MASSGGGDGVRPTKRPLGFMKHAMARKDSFIQWFAMTGILLLSMRSLGQKYRIHSLQEENYTLQEEHDLLAERINNIKRDLLHEASEDSTGAFASRLRYSPKISICFMV